MTKQQAKDAALKTLIGLAVVAAWQAGPRLWTFVGNLREIVQAWPDVKAAVEANDVWFED